MNPTWADIYLFILDAFLDWQCIFIFIFLCVWQSMVDFDCIKWVISIYVGSTKFTMIH